MDNITYARAKKYTDSVALNGVPINYPQVDPTTKTWKVFNPVSNSYQDTGIVAEGKNAPIPSIGSNGNWFIGTADTGVPATGKDGRDVEIAADTAYIKWRLSGDPAWMNLVPLAALKGTDGDEGSEIDLRMSGTVLQWQFAGDNGWHDIYDFSNVSIPAKIGEYVPGAEYAAEDAFIDPATRYAYHVIADYTSVSIAADLTAGKIYRFGGQDVDLTDYTKSGDVTAAVGAEKTERESAVTEEATARGNADTALQGSIDAEKTAREGADTAEATARSTADTTLQKNIGAIITALVGYLQKAGGIMTGALTLNGDPTEALHATTKQWTEALVAAAMSKSLKFQGYITDTEPVNMLEGEMWYDTALAPRIAPDTSFPWAVKIKNSGTLEDGTYTGQVNDQWRDVGNSESWYFAGDVWERLDFNGSVFGTEFDTSGAALALALGAIANDKIAENAEIDQSKIAGLVTTLAAINSAITAVTDRFGTIADADIADSANIDQSKIKDLATALAALVAKVPTTVVDELVAFSDTTGGQKPSGKKITDFLPSSLPVIDIPADPGFASFFTGVLDKGTKQAWVTFPENTISAPYTSAGYGRLEVWVVTGVNYFCRFYDAVSGAMYLGTVVGANNHWEKVLTTDNAALGNVIGPPDYKNIRNANNLLSTVNSSWTATESGYIRVGANISAVSDASWSILIDDLRMFHFGIKAGGARYDSEIMPITKGQTVKLTSETAATLTSIFGYFVPALPVVAGVPTVNNVVEALPDRSVSGTVVATGSLGTSTPMTFTPTTDGFIDIVACAEKEVNVGQWFRARLRIGNNVTMPIFVIGVAAEKIRETLSVIATPVRKGETVTVSLLPDSNISPLWIGLAEIRFVPKAISNNPIYVQSQPVLNYSTAEQKTGERYGGKDVYQKTFESGFTSALAPGAMANIVLSGMPSYDSIIEYSLVMVSGFNVIVTCFTAQQQTDSNTWAITNTGTSNMQFKMRNLTVKYIK